jgi:methyltransferase family protein
MDKLLDHAKRAVSTCLWKSFGISVEIHRRRQSKWSGLKNRFEYQKRYVKFDIRPGDRVLDIGNGGDPFPYATVLADRYFEKTHFRGESLVRHDKPFAVADIQRLPFADKCMDYVYCAHVLELVENPLIACKELMRVGKRGFVETPTEGKDTLFAWARNLQKWHVVAIGKNLCFFEYSDRQLDGIRSSAWREMIFSEASHKLQEAFFENQDVFNILFTWNEEFSVFVFYLDGTVRTLNGAVEAMSGRCTSQTDRAADSVLY